MVTVVENSVGKLAFLGGPFPLLTNIIFTEPLIVKVLGVSNKETFLRIKDHTKNLLEDDFIVVVLMEHSFVCKSSAVKVLH